MPESPAERLVSLNQQAIAILRLKIPLDFGFGPDTAEELREINDRLMIDIGNEQSVDSLLQKHQFPSRYQAIAKMLLASDDPAPVFESIALQQLDRENAANPFRQALAEPVVIATLVYLGMLLLCINAVPHIEAQYTQEGRSPSGATAWLMMVRDTMPYWGIGFPLLLVAILCLWYRFLPNTLMRHFPGSSPYIRWRAAESQSQRLAVLVNAGIDDDAALSLASSSVTPQMPIRPIAESIIRDGDQSSRYRALQRLASFYDFLADDRQRTYFAKTPAFVGLLLAGVIVLCFGLATFLPWIEILSNLTESGGS